MPDLLLILDKWTDAELDEAEKWIRSHIPPPSPAIGKLCIAVVLAILEEKADRATRS
jgi:hypothetical protein